MKVRFWHFLLLAALLSDCIERRSASSGVSLDGEFGLVRLPRAEPMPVAIDLTSRPAQLLRQSFVPGSVGSETLLLIDKDATGKFLKSYPHVVNLTRQDSILLIHLQTTEPAPSFTAETPEGETVAVRELFIGTAVDSGGAVTEQVALSPEWALAEVTKGVERGRWALVNAKLKLPIRAARESACRGESPQRFSELTRQVYGQDPVFVPCALRPEEANSCEVDEVARVCLAPAPVNDSPFSQVGEILASGTAPIRPIDEAKRRYIFGGVFNPSDPPNQVAEDAKAELAFVARGILATTQDNAQKCGDLFEAQTTSVNGYLHDVCEAKPAPSPEPSASGKLKCWVKVSFKTPQTFSQMNCYIRGLFKGQDEPVEELQLVKRMTIFPKP